MKRVVILGSTGSIGTQALQIVRNNPSRFQVKALACNSNIGLLAKQIEEFSPEAVAVFEKEKADSLRADIPVLSGMEGLAKLASLDSCDIVLNSMVGSIGIVPTVEAIKASKDVALANKETLVAAGRIVMQLAKKKGVQLTPIDSEHSAIFQCLKGEDSKDIRKIILTCSGGSFRDRSAAQLKNVTKEDALKHPNWNMGAKITIDSATLMNKGLEVIEAHHLFKVDYGDIDVVIHPQSIVHSLVEFKDTSVLAQLGWPDMKIPIQYALSYPKRFASEHRSLNLAQLKSLDFREPDLDLFPCLGYAYEAGKAGGTMPAAMNAANEVAVRAFLDNKIGFLDIAERIKETLDNHKIIKQPSLDQILEVDKRIKDKAEER